MNTSRITSINREEFTRIAPPALLLRTISQYPPYYSKIDKLQLHTLLYCQNFLLKGIADRYLIREISKYFSSTDQPELNQLISDSELMYSFRQHIITLEQLALNVFSEAPSNNKNIIRTHDTSQLVGTLLKHKKTFLSYGIVDHSTTIHLVDSIAHFIKNQIALLSEMVTDSDVMQTTGIDFTALDHQRVLHQLLCHKLAAKFSHIVHMLRSIGTLDESITRLNVFRNYVLGYKHAKSKLNISSYAKDELNYEYQQAVYNIDRIFHDHHNSQEVLRVIIAGHLAIRFNPTINMKDLWPAIDEESEIRKNLISQIMKLDYLRAAHQQIATELGTIDLTKVLTYNPPHNLKSGGTSMHKLLSSYAEAKLLLKTEGLENWREYIHQVIRNFVSHLSLEQLSEIYNAGVTMNTATGAQLLYQLTAEEIIDRGRISYLFKIPFKKRHYQEFLVARQLRRHFKL